MYKCITIWVNLIPTSRRSPEAWNDGNWIGETMGEIILGRSFQLSEILLFYPNRWDIYHGGLYLPSGYD